MTKRSNRTRGTRRDVMAYGLKARAIQGGRNRKRGSDSLPVPIFILQPEDWSGDEFDSAQFTAEAVSPNDPPSPVLAYQWQWRESPSAPWQNLQDGVQENGTVVSGATTDTLDVANISGNADGSQVRCTATNEFGTGYSQPANIQVAADTWFIISELGDGMIDEPGTNDIVDERSL